MVGTPSTKGKAGKQIGFVRYCSFESEYRGDSFSSLFPFLTFLSFSLFLVVPFVLYQRARENAFFSFCLSFSRVLLGTYALCKSRRECVSVRITNRKRFSYLLFIKRNEHVRIDIRPISVCLDAPALSRYLHGTLPPPAGPAFVFYMRVAATTRLHERNKSSST